MELAEKYLYDENLSKYTSIMVSRNAEKEEILNCIRIFEKFEDYEKCQDLLNLLYSLKNDEEIGKTVR